MLFSNPNLFQKYLGGVLRLNISHKSATFDAVVKGCQKEIENGDNEKDVMLNVAAICFIFILKFEIEGAFIALLDCQHVMQSLTFTTLICQSYQVTAINRF